VGLRLTADHPRTFHSALTLPVFRVEMRSIDLGIGIERDRECAASRIFEPRYALARRSFEKRVLRRVYF